MVDLSSSLFGHVYQRLNPILRSPDLRRHPIHLFSLSAAVSLSRSLEASGFELSTHHPWNPWNPWRNPPKKLSQVEY
jgi:hypothetical protein